MSNGKFIMASNWSVIQFHLDYLILIYSSRADIGSSFVTILIAKYSLIEENLSSVPIFIIASVVFS